MNRLGLLLASNWEEALFAFVDQFIESGDTDWKSILNRCRSLRSDSLRTAIVRGVCRCIKVFQMRQPQVAICWASDTQCLRALSVFLEGPNGVTVAQTLMAYWKRRDSVKGISEIEEDIRLRSPAFDRQVQAILSDWIGAARTGPAVRVQSAVGGDPMILDQISATNDVARLMEWLHHEDSHIVSAVALRLLDLDSHHVLLLAGWMIQHRDAPQTITLGDTITLWPMGHPSTITAISDLLERHELLAAPVVWNALRMAGENNSAFDEQRLVQLTGQTLARSFEESFVRKGEFARFAENLRDETRKRQCYLENVQCRHPHVYIVAVDRLMDRCLHGTSGSTSDSVADLIDGLIRFLECGTQRETDQRQRVARFLWGRQPAAPLLAVLASQQIAAPQKRIATTHTSHGRWVNTNFDDPSVLTLVRSLAALGHEHFPSFAIEQFVVDFTAGTPSIIESGKWMLRKCEDENTRKEIATLIFSSNDRSRKIRQIAQLFSDGIELGRRLTGSLFRIELIGGEDLGYTRLQEKRIYINPLPVLRGTPHGRDIVMGLIAHEYGHHMYHADSEAMKIWQRVRQEGLHELMNIVSDEHLERNLRGQDRKIGDQLKRLGAHAFSSGAKSIELDDVLQILGCDALDLLRQCPPSVSLQPYCFLLRGATLLQTMERRGNAFSRFFRALRLGLGNRHDDPQVAKALALFPKSFRHSTMAQLYDICLKLCEIFGDNVCRNPPAQCITLDSDGDMLIEAAAGMTNSELQSEIMRILAPPGESGTAGTGGGVRAINVGKDLDFPPIHQIKKLLPDPVGHAALVRDVASTAGQLRQFLADLGRSTVRVRRRTSGRHLDRGAVRDLVVRGDPRILTARQTVWKNDVFIALVIDCSGSMRFGDHMPKARRFAATITEACRPLEGIDARIFGFTDRVIYDAGTAKRPAIAALHADDGNNDAAALQHA
ncbi:MAG: hypothetical protein AAFN70_03140, partial [Planctomycetota bacterium]